MTVIKICANQKCGQTFSIDPGHQGGSPQIYCSHRCMKNHVWRRWYAKNGRFDYVPRSPTIKICADPKCKHTFLCRNANQKYCEPRCKERHYREKNVEKLRDRGRRNYADHKEEARKRNNARYHRLRGMFLEMLEILKAKTPHME